MHSANSLWSNLFDFQAPAPVYCLDGSENFLGSVINIVALLLMASVEEQKKVEDPLAFDGMLLMGPVPKKKTTHSKKRNRMRDKWIYEQVWYA